MDKTGFNFNFLLRLDLMKKRNSFPLVSEFDSYRAIYRPLKRSFKTLILQTKGKSCH